MAKRSQEAKAYRKRHNAWNDARRDRNRLQVAEYKAKHGCDICGESDPSALVFHHLNPDDKFINISTLYRRKWEIIQREIDKCQVLCQNCHQRVEYKGYDQSKVPNHKARKREMVHKHQSAEGCVDCGESDPIVLMSVYIHESEKSREAITKMVTKGRPIDSIREALDLTYTICRNCYSKRENLLPTND